MTWPQILGLSGVAALFSVVGTLAATWLKDGYLARRSEGRAADRELLATYARYRDPILLAAREAKGRLEDICEHYPPAYLRTDVLRAVPAAALRANSAADPYFQQYRLISTVYRLCALFGWLERYRREVTFLDTGSRATTRSLGEAIERLRGDLADGQLNQVEGWFRWTDRLVFREEQRAVGAGMLVADGAGGAMGYGEFRILFRNAAAGDESLWWITVVTTFLLDLEDERDFRRTRFDLMRGHLSEIVGLLDPDVRRSSGPTTPYRSARSRNTEP